MIKIIATPPKAKRHTTIDKTFDAAEADFLLTEYRMALPGWQVAVLRSSSQTLIEQIITLRAAGKTNREICEITGREERIIIHHINDLVGDGLVDRRKAGTKEKFPERNQRIVDLRNAGMTERQIATELNINWYTVRSLLYKFRKQGKL